MTELERIRHSAAHVLATAILRIWPDAQFAAGPPVENGFYYDVELSHRITPEDFPRIEAEMKAVDEGEPACSCASSDLARGGDEARLTRGALASACRDRAKVARASSSSISSRSHSRGRGRSRSITNGDFVGSLRRPARHVAPGNVGAFKLTHVARAPITSATKRTRSSSASTARRSRTGPRWTSISPCWRSRRSATTASWARSWNYSPLTRMSAPVCRCGCLVERRSCEVRRELVDHALPALPVIAVGPVPDEPF